MNCTFRLRVTIKSADDPGGVVLTGEKMTAGECDEHAQRLRVMLQGKRFSIETIDTRGRVVKQMVRA